MGLVIFFIVNKLLIEIGLLFLKCYFVDLNIIFGYFFVFRILLLWIWLLNVFILVFKVFMGIVMCIFVICFFG